MCMGKRIKALRQEKGLSQGDLANKLKYLNQSQVSKIEKGYRKVTVTDLIEFAKALDVSMSELVRENNRKEETS